MARLLAVLAACSLHELHGLQQQKTEWSPEQISAQAMRGATQDQKKSIGRDIQKFIQSAPEGFATLVVVGDSTMSSLVSGFMDVIQSMTGDMGENIYVSNDRAHMIRYGGGVKPGEDWIKEGLNLTMDKVVAARGRASTKALHDKGCKSGGGIETHVFREGPFKNLVLHNWGFLPEYTDFCWDDCMTDSMAALKPTAVLWNNGFHLLNHDFNAGVCNQRHNPTKKNCGDYKQMVKLAMGDMLTAGVPHVIWKTTNYLCEERQVSGRFSMTEQALTKWHDVQQRPVLEESCKKDCPQYHAAGMKCYDWFFDAHTTERMYTESLQAVWELRDQHQGGVHVLDAFNVTKECCGGGCEDKTDDGEHYAGLDAELVTKLAAILGQNLARA